MDAPLINLKKHRQSSTFGRRREYMNLTDIPDYYGDFETYHQSYKQHHFTYAVANQWVVDATRVILMSCFPVGLRSLIDQAIPKLLRVSLYSEL